MSQYGDCVFVNHHTIIKETSMDKQIEAASAPGLPVHKMKTPKECSTVVDEKQIKHEPVDANWHEVPVNVSDTLFVKIEAGDSSEVKPRRDNVDYAAIMTGCSMEIVPADPIKSEDLKPEYPSEEHKFLPEMSQVHAAMDTPTESNLTMEDADAVESKILLRTQIKQEPLDKSRDGADASGSIIVEIDNEDDNLEEKHWMDSIDEASATVSSGHNWQPFRAEASLAADMNNTTGCRTAEISNAIYKYSCNHCNYKCMYASNLKFHMMTHTGEKPFVCNHCDYKCSQASFLKRHVRTHTGEKPFSCDHCDYKCSQARDLKIHILNHSGVKEFNCEHCDYKCSQASHLKRHVRTHTGVKPYSCDRCDYKCTQADNLKRHLRTHTGEKPFKCEQCNYKCRQVCHLKRHLKMHADGKALLCDYCDYKCGRVDSLDRHLSTHLGEEG